MFGTLRKVKITDDLIMNVARERFASCNEGMVLDEQREYVRIGWIKGADDMLEDLNDLVAIFKKLKIDFEFDNSGRWHDVEEFYKE